MCALAIIFDDGEQTAVVEHMDYENSVARMSMLSKIGVERATDSENNSARGGNMINMKRMDEEIPKEGGTRFRLNCRLDSGSNPWPGCQHEKVIIP
jgi:hypothetical protein